MMPLGQFRDTFIIAVDDEGIVIIDQHVAHERVLFERILRAADRRRRSSRSGLLVPMVIDLPGAGHAHAARPGRRPGALRLRGRGLRRRQRAGVGRAGAAARPTTSTATLRALADDLEQLDRGLVAEQALKQIAATMACHAAVQAHDPLTREKMTHILDELRATAYSTVCPHGRPVMLRLSRRDLERRFERI